MKFATTIRIQFFRGLGVFTALAFALPCFAQDAARAQLKTITEKVLTEKQIPGAVVAVVRDSEILQTTAYGVSDVEEQTPLRDDCIMPVGSVTKVLTASLYAVLVDEGVISSDDFVARFLPENVQTPAWANQVTLEHLVTHTSGLPREPNNRKNVANSPSMMEPYDIAELYECVESVELEAAPGRRWQYSNLGFALLGHLLERAADEEFETLLKRKLLEPLQMDDTGIYPDEATVARIPSGYWPEDNRPIARPRWEFGEVAAFSGAYSTGEDLCHLLLANMADDGSGLARVLSAMHEPQFEISQQPRREIATAWFIDHLPGGLKAIGHGGEVDSFSCCIAMIPQMKLGIVVLTNKGDDSAETICRAVMPALMRPPR